MPKSSKRFILSTSAVNSYGFRVLTEGIDLEQFNKNPVMLFNHTRPKQYEGKNQILPIGYWEDISIDGDVLMGTPVFDDSDDFAMSIYAKVENGTLRMASIGGNAIETTTEASLMLVGQTQPTVTKLFLSEVSIVDMGGNDDAIALYDTDMNAIELTNAQTLAIALTKETKTNIEKMKQITLNHESVAGLLDLSEKADGVELVAKIQDAVQLNVELKKELDTSKQELGKLKAEQQSEKVVTLVSQAIADKKILEGEKEAYVKLATQDYDTVKQMLDAKPAHVSANAQLEKQAKGTATDYAQLSFDELHKTGKLAYVKLNMPELYAQKHKEKFNK
ncbi:MAG: HK97 family phage prohead protease [Sphingobacteriaceae bacterium]|nr:HK97 family phage prohead protease [Sphingobacteriaceae bacterium]